LQSAVLGSTPIFSKHTAINIAEQLSCRLEEFAINKEAIAAFVTDEGGAPHHFDATTIHCAGYLLQTVQRRAYDTLIMQNPAVFAAVEACRSVVTAYRNSAANQSYLTSLRLQTGTPISAFVTECPTRWNTRLQLLKSVQASKGAISEWIQRRIDSGKRNVHVAFMHNSSPHCWNIISDLVTILDHLEVATKELSQDKVPTLHLITLVFCRLHANLDKYISSLASRAGPDFVSFEE
jgi:hypothetical protein